MLYEEIKQSYTPVKIMFEKALKVFNVESLKKGYFDSFTRIKKYVMPSQFLIDLDTPLDWQIVENMIRNHD